jgi:branched-chain amino acid transport system ATP-binding protein
MIALEGIQLSHRFGGVLAVQGLDLQVEEGRTLAVIGPNGAGKTTLFNLLAGTLKARDGKVLLEGRDISRYGPERRAGLGLIRSFQHGRTFANLSAEDNLLLGAHGRRLAGRSGPAWFLAELAGALFPFGPFRREEARLRAEAGQLVEPFGERLAPHLERPAYSFSYANRRRIEIARALAAHPRVLLLDEPTAGMNPAETLEMIEFLQALKQAGMTMVIIEHKLPLIMQLADSVLVMDEGRKIAEDHPARIPHNPQVIEAYLGPNHLRGATA